MRTRFIYGKAETQIFSYSWSHYSAATSSFFLSSGHTSTIISNAKVIALYKINDANDNSQTKKLCIKNLHLSASSVSESCRPGTASVLVAEAPGDKSGRKPQNAATTT